MKRTAKKLVSILTCMATVLSLAACGSSASSSSAASSEATSESVSESAAEETEAAFTVADTDEEIYMNAFGDFYEAYLEAMDAETVSERHALLAVAEAKALEASGGATMYGPTAGYIFTRLVYRSSGYAPWRGTMSNYGQYLLTNEIITSEDNEELKAIYKETSGTGTYIDTAVEYLTGKGYTFNDTYTSTFSDNATTWDIFAASTMNDSTFISPTLDYLFAYDAEGELVPCLATGYEISDDGLVYTVHIREGLSWVDSQGRKVADLTADDWVAAAQHQADLQEYYTLGLYIDGFTEYATGATTDFSTVGVKAVDDYTLEYTLTSPATYFHTMLQSSDFYPMCRSYFLSQGGAFGVAEYAEASAQSSYTYGTDQNHIAYCGQFLCTNMTEKNSATYVLNDSYWNADNARITSIKLVYDDGTDTNRSYDNFMSGILTQTYLRSAQIETAKENGDFDKYATTSETGRASFSFWFNLNRQTYANMADGAAASQKTDEEKEISRAAFQNQHFRLALNYSIDRATYVAQNVGEDLKSISLRNTMTPGDYVSLEDDATISINGVETTFPAGTWYGEIIQAQLDADEFPVTVWDAENQTSDGWDAWYDPEKAAEEIAIAVEELATLGYEVTADNPIVVDFPCSTYNEVGQNQGYVLKTCIEEATGGLVRFDLLPLNNSTEFLNVANNTNSGSEINDDMGCLGTYGSDHGDPQCYTEGLLPYGDGSLTEKMGLW